MDNPALNALLARIGEGLVLAQVMIRPQGAGFLLCHVADVEAPPTSLRSLAPESVRALAAHTAEGAFRPLKSAPNLAAGWTLSVGSAQGLWDALNLLYPGAVADLFAAQSPVPPITSFRDYTRRQSGMYRVAAMLNEAQATLAIRACCQPGFCLKRRLWSVEGLEPDGAAEKSLIPCLEPCAILLEFARKAMRLEQGEPGPTLRTDEVASVEAALEQALRHPIAGVREGDLNHAGNPRRLQLLLEKLRRAQAKETH